MIIKAMPFIFVTALAATQPAFAGTFSVSCSYMNDNLKECAAAISDIVTEKYIAKFPASRFQIFVHSNIFGYTNGGYSAYAVAGVIPKNSGQFPRSRFSSAQSNGTDTKFSQIDLANYELENFRSAVRRLMEQCEISPNCDVYIAR